MQRSYIISCFVPDLETLGVVMGIGIKQKIGRTMVVNIEQGLFLGKTYSNYYGGMNKFQPQYYPLKVSLGIRLGDWKKKKN